MNPVTSIARSTEGRKLWEPSPSVLYVLVAFTATAVCFRASYSGHSLGFKRTITILGLIAARIGSIFNRASKPTTGAANQRLSPTSVGEPPINESASPQQAHFSISKASATEVFWELGNHFWMQIMDGKYHQYGPTVFDEALHKGKKEPGFFDSLKIGCEFAAEHLTETISVTFYKSLHKKLCSHFKGPETNTVISFEEAGQFRKKSCQCRPSIYSKEFNSEAFTHSKNVTLYNMRDALKEHATDDFTKKYQEICENYPASKKWLDNWDNLWDKRVKEVNLYVERICQELGIRKIVNIYKLRHLLYTDYLCDDAAELEQIAERLFERYKRKIQEINSRPCDSQTFMKQKAEVIAELYQLLEWLHPFPDGQGRTDLVLMAKALSEEGLTPAILKEPYTSTYSILSEWTNDLLEGMQLWKEQSLLVKKGLVTL